MDLLLFYHTKWAQLYDCSLLNESQWEAQRRPYKVLGLAYGSTGAVFIILYLICLRVMWRHSRSSCLKIMILLGIMDIANLALNAVLTGYFTYTGAVYCSSPMLSYVGGALVFGFWCNCCATSVLLALNRSLELLIPHKMNALFGGYRTLFWFILPFLYGFYFTWFTPAPTYSSKGYAWFFDPYLGIEEIKVDKRPYLNPGHEFHNTATPVVIFIFYTFISLILWYKTRKTATSVVTRFQKKLLLQSCIICLFNVTACLLYIYIQHQADPPTWLVIVTQILWICCNCGAVVIYLILNETIRKGFLDIVVPKRFWECRTPKVTAYPPATSGVIPVTHAY